MTITVIKVILANNDKKVWLYFYISAPRAELELAQIYTGTCWDLIFNGKKSMDSPWVLLAWRLLREAVKVRAIQTTTRRRPLVSTSAVLQTRCCSSSPSLFHLIWRLQIIGLRLKSKGLLTKLASENEGKRVRLSLDSKG